MKEMSDMTFGFMMLIIAGGMTMISLGVIIIATNILKAFQPKDQ